MCGRHRKSKDIDIQLNFLRVITLCDYVVAVQCKTFEADTMTQCNMIVCVCVYIHTYLYIHICVHIYVFVLLLYTARLSYQLALVM